MLPPLPGFWRRLLAILYESMLLVAIWFIAGFVFHLIFFNIISGDYFKLAFQCYLLLVGGMYFIWFWTHGGQTLAMQTWKIRITGLDGQQIGIRKAIIRYLLAVAGVTLFGSGFIWALFDRDCQFLHDRLAGTRIVGV